MVVRDGAESDMGTAINATREDSKGACYFAATNISTEARHHPTTIGAVWTDQPGRAGL